MAEHKRGREARRELLEYLADQVDRWEVPGSAADAAKVLGWSVTTVRFHADRLRAQGLVHLGALWITRAGYAAIRGDCGLQV